MNSFFYWEFYTYAVKLLLTVTMAMLTSVSKQLQLLTALSILLFYTWSTLVSQPFQSRKLNRINSASVCTVLLFACFKLLLADVTPS